MRAPALLLVLLLTGCAGSSAAAPAQVPDTATADPKVLAAGKADLQLEPGTYFSPVDFVPPLAITVPLGWHSTHRGDDAFDLSKPDPARDAPLVAVVFDTPDDDAVATALARLKALAGPSATPLTGTLAGEPATGFDVVGGSGTLLSSPSGTISLDLAPHQHVRVLGTDIDQTPLLAVVVVPDEAQWATVLPQATALLDGVTRG